MSDAAAPAVGPLGLATGSYGDGIDPLLPLLTRIWPVPDDLPRAAGLGDLEQRPYMPKGRVVDAERRREQRRL